MAGTHSTLHNVGNRTEIKLTRVRFGIHLLDTRNKSHVDSGALHFLAISFFSTRIGQKILLIIKLCWIDKVTDHHKATFAACTVYKGDMTSM